MMYWLYYCHDNIINVTKSVGETGYLNKQELAVYRLEEKGTELIAVNDEYNLIPLNLIAAIKLIII